MAGFDPRRTESGDSTGEVRDFIQTDSSTLTLGDATRMTGGAGDQYLALVAAGNRVLGVLVGFVDQNGLPLVAQHVTDVDGTQSGTAGLIGSETYVAAADNEATAEVKGRVIIDPREEYFNDADGDLTTGDVGLYYNVVAASDQIDQSEESATTGQFILLERDPDRDSDASKGIFRVAESALFLGT